MNFSSRPEQDPADLPPEIILASQSVGRRQLLEQLGIRFRVIVTHVDESHIMDKDPLNLLKRRSIAKAEELIANPRIYNLPEEGKALIIAADSMAIRGKKTYGKPNDEADARQILRELMGKMHIFATATCIVLIEAGKETKRWTNVTQTKVTMNTLKPADFELYIHRYDFSRYAAAYALNDAPWTLISKIEGSYTNVIGLPFEELLPILKKLKIIELPAHVQSK